MKKILIASIWVMSFGFNASNAAPGKSGGGENNLINFNTPIRVLLAKGRQSIDVKSMSNALYLSTANSSQWQRYGTSAQVKISPEGRGFEVNGIVIKSTSLYLREQYPPGSLRVNGGVYRGTIKLETRPDGFWVINILPIDEYLSGIVGAEMNPNWELEALRAQVVAARSYALYMIRNPKNAYYDVEATTQDQVYAGTSVESPKVREAVLSTVGEYLAVKGFPVKAFYHSRCGGRTETAQAVWNPKDKRSKRSGVRCAYCKKNPQPWVASFSISEFYRRLNIGAAGRPLRLASLEKSASGRISSLRVGPSGKERTFSSDELRSLLGYQKLKSAYFNFFVDSNRVHFEGVGHGHGVGMCQWGARGMAQTGKSYRDILGYYYPDSSLSFRRATTAAK